MTKEQRAWCKRYEQNTTFEPLMDDFLAGNITFVVAAKRSNHWFEVWSSDAYRAISQIPGEFDEWADYPRNAREAGFKETPSPYDLNAASPKGNARKG